MSENFDINSQELLSKAKVLVVGAGGLGSHVLQQITAAGVGTIGIVEFDKVSLSNLNRQTIYSTADINLNKTDCAKRFLNNLNPDVEVVLYNCRFANENGIEIVANYDIVVDCTDNYNARIDMDIVCEKLSIPLVHSSVDSLKGIATTFCYKNGKTYRSLYGFDNPQTSNHSGALSPIVGLMASIQASEVIKIITGIGSPLYDRLLKVDLEQGDFSIFNI